MAVKKNCETLTVYLLLYCKERLSPKKSCTYFIFMNINYLTVNTLLSEYIVNMVQIKSNKSR